MTQHTYFNEIKDGFFFLQFGAGKDGGVECVCVCMCVSRRAATIQDGCVYGCRLES